MQQIKIPSGKNKLSAVINDPNEKTDKLAILCPGFLDSKDYNGLLLLARDLANLGYTVVRFNPTGTWDSEGSIEKYTTTQYLKDIQNVLEYMLKESEYKHILLGGHSRGGQISLLYAARDSRISEIIAIMPSSPYTFTKEIRENWGKDGVRLVKRDIPEGNGTKDFHVPFSHALDRDQYNVIEDIKKLHIPIIFIAGELDHLVKPEHVKNIFEIANNPKKFILLKNIGHDYRHNISQVEEVNKQILKELTPNQT
ncbi:MAG: alpha/beta hydrolase [Candidatus Doudnabacteria bacterium]